VTLAPLTVAPDVLGVTSGLRKYRQIACLRCVLLVRLTVNHYDWDVGPARADIVQYNILVFLLCMGTPPTNLNKYLHSGTSEAEVSINRSVNNCSEKLKKHDFR